MKTKRILSIILTILLVVSALPTVEFNVRASSETVINTTGFAGGSGTQENPYLIETKVHLNNVRNNLGAHYKMISNIVFTDLDFQEDGDFYNNGAGWLPIGNGESNAFTGTFDGNGYRISNIRMNYSVNADTNIGFFGVTKGSVKNLLLSGSVNFTITNPATYYVGGLVGYASGEVINCTSECEIKVSSSFASAIVDQSTLYLGGIAGYSKQRIENCKNNGTITVTEKSYDDVTARGYVGGICGYAEQSVIRCDNFNSILVQAMAGTGYDVGIAYATGGICGVLDGVLDHSKNAGNIEMKDARESENGYSFYAGGIVGISKAQSKIIDSSNRGSVRSGVVESYSGGIVAENLGSVSRCSNLGEIYAATSSKGVYHSISYSGGICGYSSGDVTESYNTGIVLWDQLGASSDNYTGGIVGRLTNASITNCYNAGHVAENMFMGNGAGIVGYSNSSATISNCYNVGAAGMSAGIMGGTAKTTNCYYLEYANSSTDKGDTAAKVCTEAEMMHQDTFVGFDFDEIWTYDSSTNYFFPVLKNNVYKDEDFVDNTIEFAGGDGSFAHPYLIANSTHINNIKKYPRCFFKLSSDIDMKNISWTQYAFYGVLDGAGHSIKNLTNSLFLNTEGCIVNLHLEDANIGDSGFVGQFHFGKILNCSFSGKAVSGGFVWDASGPIVNCVNYGTINGGGGIAGTVAGTSGDAGSWKGVLIGCVNFGTIYGNYNAGGLAGSSNGSDIINCYNAGNVYGGSSAGGIVGSIKQADVINCYNVGVVSTGSNGTAGALIGEHSSGYAENCYYLDNMSSAGPDETIAGTILDYNDISKRSSFVGFDFNSVWTMEGSENYSYPELLRTPIVVGEFTPSYTVVFKNWNGDILDSATYRYGEQVVTPENPIRQGEDGYFYSFVGWDKEIVPCNGNAVYTAVYDKTEIVITSIAVTKKPNKTNYLEGDAFEKTGMVVTAYYNNNTSATVTDYTVSGYTSTPGTKTITVTYSGKTTTFTVEVVTKALTNIAVTKMPTKTTFLEAKDELTVIGGQITLYYNNGTTQTIDMIPSMVSGFDNNTVGYQTLTVTYNGKTTRYNIEIMAKSLTSIELIDNGLKKEYLEGKDLLDITNGTVRLHYNNGTYSDIALTPAMVLDFNNTVVGNQILTVIYGGFTDTYSIEIIEKSLMAIELIKMPSKLEYLANNDSLDVENGRIKLIYNNDTFEEKDLTKSMISGFDNTIVGKQDLTITYHGKTTTYQIEVLIDYTPGDIDGVEGVTDRDAVYLLYYTFLPDMYPINQDCDFNGDGEVNDKDAVYLLYYTFLPDLYPIN